MSTEAHPDQDTVSMIRKAIANHCNRHKGLGLLDAKEWFFSLAHDAYEQDIGVIINMECSQCLHHEAFALPKGEAPPSPEAFICLNCLFPEDEDE